MPHSPVAGSLLSQSEGEDGVALTELLKGMPGFPNSLGLQPCGQYSARSAVIWSLV